MSTKNKLIVHTGSHKKAIINLELAESMLSKELLNKLNSILIELNHIQEFDDFLSEIDKSGKKLIFKKEESKWPDYQPTTQK
jgi:hypothetical protein